MSNRVPQTSELCGTPQGAVSLVHSLVVICDLLVELGLGCPTPAAFGDMFLFQLWKVSIRITRPIQHSQYREDQ